MAAKGKTRATLSAIAITAALISPRIALAGLIDPRAAIAVKSPVHAEPINERVPKIAPGIDEERAEVAVEAARSLHGIAPGEVAEDSKTRIRGSRVHAETRTQGEGGLRLQLHWGFDHVYGETASGSLLGPGGGPTAGGFYQQGPNFYMGGGATGFDNGVGYTAVHQTLLYRDSFVEPGDMQGADFFFAAGAIKQVGPTAINWAWKSIPTFGHTFLRHGAGARLLRGLMDRARSTGLPQGQWLDNPAAAKFLQNIAGELQGPASMRIPQGLGQVILPTGEIVEAAGATMIPNGAGGFTSAFPIFW